MMSHGKTYIPLKNRLDTYKSECYIASTLWGMPVVEGGELEGFLSYRQSCEGPS